MSFREYKCNGCNKKVENPLVALSCPNCNHTVFRPVSDSDVS